MEGGRGLQGKKGERNGSRVRGSDVIAPQFNVLCCKSAVPARHTVHYHRDCA
jgi:hypothetical protein